MLLISGTLAKSFSKNPTRKQIKQAKVNEILRGLTIRGFTPKRELLTGSIHP